MGLRLGLEADAETGPALPAGFRAWCLESSDAVSVGV